MGAWNRVDRGQEEGEGMGEEMKEYNEMPLTKLFDLVKSYEGKEINRMTDDEIREYLEIRTISRKRGAEAWETIKSVWHSLKRALGSEEDEKEVPK